MYYAQLDDNGICISVSDLQGEVKDSKLIELKHMDISLLGKLYEDGKWVDVPDESEADTSLSVGAEELYEMQLIQMSAIADLYENQEKDKLTLYAALADICEMIMGGDDNA